MSREVLRTKGARDVKVVQPPVRVKILSCGDGGSGKSCLIKRYCEERFVSKYISTIGVDYGVKRVKIDGKEIRINLWDLSGHPEFFEVRNEFYKDAQAVLLVFDVSSKGSFSSLEDWLEEAVKYGAKDAIYFVCGNKVDLRKRVVSEREARSWANSNNFRYYETSASTGQNVKDVFESLVREIVRREKYNV